MLGISNVRMVGGRIQASIPKQLLVDLKINFSSDSGHLILKMLENPKL